MLLELVENACPGAVFDFKVELEHNYGTTGIIEEARGTRKKRSICIARTLVVPEDGTALIRSANFIDREINSVLSP